jgi:dihydrofolate reductase
MSKLRVHGFGMSLDGYSAGPDQSLEHPMGKGGMGLHQWVLPTRYFKRMHAPGPQTEGSLQEAGTTGIDNDFAEIGFDNVGAWIMGRNMFGPERGPWLDSSWRGWWGDNPPYHVPVFVFTHHARPALEMEGGTVFHFVSDSIETVLARARQAAGSRDVRLGGGVSTVRQFLSARLVDEMHVPVSPVRTWWSRDRPSVAPLRVGWRWSSLRKRGRTADAAWPRASRSASSWPRP